MWISDTLTVLIDPAQPHANLHLQIFCYKIILWISASLRESCHSHEKHFFHQDLVQNNLSRTKKVQNQTHEKTLDGI